MDFVPWCIRVMVAVAVLAMSVAFDPGQSVPASDHDAVSVALDSGLSADTLARIELMAGEIGLANRDCPPDCPTGCAHSANTSCCASLAVGSSAFSVVITAGAVVPYEADQSLSGFEPDAPQEPPQLSA
jgi:hypothetical protein